MKSLGSDGSSTKFYQTFREELTLIFLKLFHEIEKEEAFPNIFYEAGITLIPKHTKTYQGKKTTEP